MAKRWTEDDLKVLNSLREEGKTLKEIAFVLGRSFEAVKLKAYNVWKNYYKNNLKGAALSRKKGRDWHRDNKEISLEKKREWYKGNKDHHHQLVKAARAADSDHYKSYAKKWNEDNHDKLLEYGRRWDAKHPLKRKQINDRRRVKIGEMVGTHTSTEWKKRIKEFENKCAYCEVEFDSKIKVTRDHLIPIDIQAIGYIWNIVPACQSCNSGKHTSDCISFIKKSGYSLRSQLAIALENLQDI